MSQFSGLKVKILFLGQFVIFGYWSKGNKNIYSVKQISRISLTVFAEIRVKFDVKWQQIYNILNYIITTLQIYYIYLELCNVIREVGRLAPDSLCNVYATSLHGPCNNKRTLYARSLHGPCTMNTLCTLPARSVPARSMQRLCNVYATSLHGPCTGPYEHRLLATFVITAPQLHITNRLLTGT